MLFVIGGDHGAVANQGGAVIQAFRARRRIADHHIDARDLAFQCFQTAQHLAVQARTQQQVFRRIGTERQFGKDDDMRLQLIPRPQDGGRGLSHITRHIAYQQVELGQRDPQPIGHGLRFEDKVT